MASLHERHRLNPLGQALLLQMKTGHLLVFIHANAITGSWSIIYIFLTLLHSEWSKLYGVLTILSVIGLNMYRDMLFYVAEVHLSIKCINSLAFPKLQAQGSRFPW